MSTCRSSTHRRARPALAADHALCDVRLRQFRQPRHHDRRPRHHGAVAARGDQCAGPEIDRLGHADDLPDGRDRRCADLSGLIPGAGVTQLLAQCVGQLLRHPRPSHRPSLPRSDARGRRPAARLADHERTLPLRADRIEHGNVGRSARRPAAPLASSGRAQKYPAARNRRARRRRRATGARTSIDGRRVRNCTEGPSSTTGCPRRSASRSSASGPRSCRRSAVAGHIPASPPTSPRDPAL